MQRYFGIGIDKNQIILDKSDYHHIKNVMRNRDGDQIEVIYDDRLYICIINNVKNDLEINIKDIIELKKNTIPKINIIIPILKEQKIDFILQKAAEMGVDKITIVPFERCMVKLNSKIDSKITRWKRILKEASEQSFRNYIPSLQVVSTLKDLECLVGVKIVCSTKKNLKNIKFFLNKNKNSDIINVVVGPEGGISPNEEDFLNNIGFTSISLGDRILRVESVPLFFMSCINYEYMEW